MRGGASAANKKKYMYWRCGASAVSNKKFRGVGERSEQGEIFIGSVARGVGDIYTCIVSESTCRYSESCVVIPGSDHD